MEMEQIGSRIATARALAGLTQTELATLLGVTRGTITRWEKGSRNPSDEDKHRIAKALNTTVAYLMGETNEPVPKKVSDGHEQKLMTDEHESGKQAEMVPKKIPGGLWQMGNIYLVPRLSPEYSPHCGGTGIAFDVSAQTEEGEYEPIAAPILGPIDPMNPPRAFRVDGTSVTDYGIPPDSWIIVNPAIEPVTGNLALVEIGGSPVIKKIYIRPDGIALRSSNGEEYFVDRESMEVGFVRICGKIVRADMELNHRP
jgi:transcriptional regulator with XRE-family HTH domain